MRFSESLLSLCAAEPDETMKRLLAISMFFLFSVSAYSQSPVAVTATVTGSNSAPFASGTWTAQLVDSTGAALASATINGSTITQVAFSGPLSPTGALSVSLYANSALGPYGHTNGDLPSVLRPRILIFR